MLLSNADHTVLLEESASATVILSTVDYKPEATALLNDPL
jgi:hypothetical protein